jgi:fucose permease
VHADDADGCCGRMVVNSRIPWLEYWVVFCVSTFLLMGAGTEVGLAGWISNYAVAKYEATEQTGALLTSAFWFGMTGGRFIAVPMALKFTPRMMLTMDIVLGLVGLAILYWTPNLTGDWVGTIICGVAIASMFPSAMSLPVSLNMRVSGTATSWFVSGASLGEMLIPFVMVRAAAALPPPPLLLLLLLLLLQLLLLVAVLKCARVAHCPPPPRAHARRACAWTLLATRR